jgi:transposase
MRRPKRTPHIAKQGGQRLAAELRGKDLSRVLVVPIDGGKHSHKALIANALGDIVRDTFEFGNDLPGAMLFDKEVQEAARQVEALHILVGIEPTGHYVENFVEALLQRAYQVREVNPLAVRREREAGLTWCKTDELDLCAIGQLLLNGKGRMVGQREALYYNLRQAVRTRRSSIRRRVSIEQQIHTYMDRLFPGFLSAGILGDGFGRTSVEFMRSYGSAHRVRASGVARLTRWLTKQHVCGAAQKALALVELANQGLLLSASAEEALMEALRFRLEEHTVLSAQIRWWEQRMAEYLVETPGIWLLAIREINVPSAAEYMGELGPITLYEGAGNIIGRAGLVAKRRQSATSTWEGGITKLGHPFLRYSIGVIGRNLIRRNAHFGTFYRRLVEQLGKEPGVAITAVGCKFVRISWAMMMLKGAFGAPAEDLTQDIEKKVEAFLQSMGAAELYRTKVGPRLTQVLESGGYHRRTPTPLPRQRRSKAPTMREPTRGAHSVRRGEVDAQGGVNAGLCTQERGGTFSSIGEILNAHPVVQRVRKDMEAQVS